jgi:CDP-glucose 4,6-dehydratase
VVVGEGALEGLAVNASFWRGKRVLITGHTGFKGSWLTHWLQRAGAEVTGFALESPTTPSLFDLARIENRIRSIRGDVRDLDSLRRTVTEANPEIVIHMAAQSLVRASYEDPVGTYGTNVMGTVHLLESIRTIASVRIVVIVTSDKCYENREWDWPYREYEPMGGKDPYSSSKGCAELVTAAYRSSFFTGSNSPRVATVRAGNVIGGGDWSDSRLVPDLIRSFEMGAPAMIRNPTAIRPWQFVMDPLSGYLDLAEALWSNRELASGWNFGPSDADVRPVSWIADHLSRAWGEDAGWRTDGSEHPPEALTLKLDSSRARRLLRWEPRVSLATALEWIVEFHKELIAGGDASELLDSQVARYEGAHQAASEATGILKTP